MINGTLVTLGPILPSDFAFLFRWSDDFDAALVNGAYRPAVWKSEEEFWFHSGRDPTKVLFAIRPLGTAAIVGYLKISNIDAVHRSATIGIRIGNKTDRGRGYGTEALRLALTYCWDHLNLTRLGLVVFQTNESAMRIYSGLGFEREGVLKRAVFIEGRWLDVVMMGLLHPSRTNPTIVEREEISAEIVAPISMTNAAANPLALAGAH